MSQFVVAVLILLFLTPTAWAAEEVCGYCIQSSELNVPITTGIPALDMTANPPRVSLSVGAVAALVRSNHVCTGPITQVIDPKPNGAPTAFSLQQVGYPPIELYRTHLRICDGTLVPLDEYRLKPFKDFGQVLVAGERKEFLDRVNLMAKNVEPEKVEAIVRKLLEDKEGPLSKQKADLIAQTADAVVKLIANAPPPKK